LSEHFVVKRWAQNSAMSPPRLPVACIIGIYKIYVRVKCRYILAMRFIPKCLAPPINKVRACARGIMHDRHIHQPPRRGFRFYEAGLVSPRDLTDDIDIGSIYDGNSRYERHD
jgi:hypothetical protein